MTKTLLTLAISDLHLSHAPPRLRETSDWRPCLARTLRQLKAIAGDKPVVCCGDIWHTFHEPAEIVNFALKHLPVMHCVAGNHDTPHHDRGQLQRSCYWTLVEAGRIIDLEPGRPVEVHGGITMRLHGFPHGTPVEPLKDPHDLMVEVAVVHQYVWTARTGYPDAPAESRLAKFRERCAGYDAVLVGDNHQSFKVGNVVNLGTLIPRTTTERCVEPSVWKIWSDSSVSRVRLDVSKDRWNEDGKMEQGEDPDLHRFARDLAGLERGSLDYRTAVERWLASHPVSDAARKAITEVMG